MSKIPHIRIPDSLLEDPRFFEALPEHQIIYLRMIRLAAFKPQEFNIRGHIIELLPGQLCYSIRKIAELSGKYCTRHHVDGAIKYFERFDFLGHEVRHKKNVITLTHSEVYKLISNIDRTTGRTEVGQQSDINNKSIPIRTTNNVVVSRENAFVLSVEKICTSGKIIKASFEEIITYSVMSRQDWETSEIEEAWKILCEYPSPITDWILFIKGTIEKRRNLKKPENHKKEEKKWNQKNLYNDSTKHQSTKDNEFYSENDTSESPLAKFARQNGLN